MRVTHPVVQPRTAQIVKPMRSSAQRTIYGTLAALVVAAVGVPSVASSDETGALFHELLSRHPLRAERACGRSPEIGDGTRLVFARGVSCKGERGARGSSALGIVSARLAFSKVPGWTCTSFDSRDAELLCYRGRDRTSSTKALREALMSAHIRAVLP
jgi:hypothetical protein